MKKFTLNKKYVLAVGVGLLTTAAVTATMLSSNKPVSKKAVKEVKCTQTTCNKSVHHCMFN